jgi:predicted ATPase
MAPLGFAGAARNVANPVWSASRSVAETLKLGALMAIDHLASSSLRAGLAIEVAGDVADAFPNGVYVVDLSPLHDEALLASAVAQVIDVRAQPERPLVDVLKLHLAYPESCCSWTTSSSSGRPRN